MKDAIKNFWRSLLEKLNNRINEWLNKDKTDSDVIGLCDDTKVNFFVMILKKVLNRVFLQCDFEVITDSALARPLVELCEDLQKNCYKIGAYMLGGSDTPSHISECWALPYFETVGGKHKLCHSYLDGSRICITGMTAGKISDCYMVLDACKRAGKIYLLCRRHVLDENGNLTISFFVSDDNAQITEAVIPEWSTLVKAETVYHGVGHIGFGRYKSPVQSFGNDTYGKPLNNGCAVIEAKIQKALEQIEFEFKASGKKLFPDESIVSRVDKDGVPLKAYSIDGYIFPVRHVPGVSGSLLDEFSPAIRESSYYAHLTALLEQYQSLMGVNELITHERSGRGATATEIKALNVDNVSLEDSIRQAVRNGNIDTLRADGIYLGIREELWSYDETWTDIYEDEQQRLKNLMELHSAGLIEDSDVVKYWFPTLSGDEIEAKLARIREAKGADTQSSIESLLNM